MILVDTSIWIDHLHAHDSQLDKLLERRFAAIHPLVIAELALGSLRARDETLRQLARLPHVRRVFDEELVTFIDTRRLWSKGLSMVDASLLASALVTPDTAIWTRDKALAAAADQLGVAWSPS